MKYLKTFESIEKSEFESEIEDLFYDFAVEIGIDKLVIRHKNITSPGFKKDEQLSVKFLFREEDPRDPPEVFESIKSKLQSINEIIKDVWGFQSAGALSSVTLLTPGYRRVLTIIYYK